MKISATLTRKIFQINTPEEFDAWLEALDREVGLTWKPLGGSENNVHAVEVAQDPGASLMERLTNGIDALLDLEAMQRNQTASSPHEAAQQWFNVPVGGVGKMSKTERASLAGRLRVENHDSGDRKRPTVTVQDAGSGQHPDAFEGTLLSIQASNKKSKYHQIGQYNAGGAASYSFSHGTIIVSRRAPQLLNSEADEIGVTVVRYDHKDPTRFKTGNYVFCAGPDGTILRGQLKDNVLPDLPHGTYIKHIAMGLEKYAGLAHGPRGGLHHLVNASLPDPPLPMRLGERRSKTFKKVKEGGEHRNVDGLLGRLDTQRNKQTRYQQQRSIPLGTEIGELKLHYFYVFNEKEGKENADAYVENSHALTLMLNGQRQGHRRRGWLKAQIGLPYVSKGLVVVADCNGLTAEARRAVFASTRETMRDTSRTDLLMKKIVDELRGDAHLRELDDERRRAELSVTREISCDRVKSRLAHKLAHINMGRGHGRRGGREPRKQPPQRKRKPNKVWSTEDSHLPDVPTTIALNPARLRVPQGRARSFYVHLDARNHFFVAGHSALSVTFDDVFEGELSLTSRGQLEGGRCRLRVSASEKAPLQTGTVTVRVHAPGMPKPLEATLELEVHEPRQVEETSSGGAPDLEIRWTDGAPAHVVASAEIDSTGTGDQLIVQRATLTLNRGFEDLKKLREKRGLRADYVKVVEELYAGPVAWAAFEAEYEERQRAGKSGGSAGGTAADMGSDDEDACARQSTLRKCANVALMMIEDKLRIDRKFDNYDE